MTKILSTTIVFAMRKQLLIKNIIFIILIILPAFSLNAFHEHKLTVVYTNSLNGQLNDCRYIENPGWSATSYRSIITAHGNRLSGERTHQKGKYKNQA